MESDAGRSALGPRTGARDEAVLDLSRRAQAQLRCQSHLAAVPGASHLPEQPGPSTWPPGWAIGQLMP